METESTQGGVMVGEPVASTGALVGATGAVVGATGKIVGAGIGASGTTGVAVGALVSVHSVQQSHSPWN